MSRSSQTEFDFQPDAGVAPTDGLDTWHAERRRAITALSQREGVPLGRRVRIEFAGGPPIEGRLDLDEDRLFLPDTRDAHLRLRVGRHTFHKHECASLTVMDD